MTRIPCPPELRARPDHRSRLTHRRSHVDHPLHPDNDPHTRPVHRRPHRLRARAARRSSATAPTTTSKVHHVGPTDADVTEGSGGVWERLHYDWSNPDRVVLTTTDSNTWGGASGYTYTFTRSPDGATDVNVVIVRQGKNAKGRFLALVLGSVGKGVLKKSFVQQRQGDRGPRRRGGRPTTNVPMRARTELAGRLDDWFDVWDRRDGAYFETEAEPYLALDVCCTRPSTATSPRSRTRRIAMRTRDSIIRGIDASAVGTLAMDTLLYRRYRGGGGRSRSSRGSPPTASTAGRAHRRRRSSPSACSSASPGAMSRRGTPGSSTTSRTGASASPPARPTDCSSDRAGPTCWYGLPFGAAVWARRYVVLPLLGVYEPIWKYDLETLEQGPECAPGLRHGDRGGVLRAG